ncbi:MAG: O-antigen ligase family protein [Burkholderiales bacterium]|nr:O-antigen ligase family protein [Burkholderiales bacterium]
MARLIFLSLLASGSLASVAAPWIGVVIAYGLAILTPQAIWHWAFEGVRPVLWILVPTFIGVVFAGLRGKLNFSGLANARCAYLALLWLFFTLSYLFGPYVSVVSPYRFHDASWVMETAHKQFLVFFIGCLCLDDTKKLRALIWVTAISLLYLIYWANSQYLSGHVWGRLAGPSDPRGGSVYADENAFALVFVVLIPYLWHLGLTVRQRWLRLILWLAIPFAWHAIFLTASRGGLLGLAIVTLVVSLRSRMKRLSVLLIPALVVAYIWQAGDLMKERADSIDQFQQEQSASARLQIWGIARAMIADHPFLGVGLASFGPAFPSYSSDQPLVAHNTFFQVAAESGVLAGLLFLLVILSSIKALLAKSKSLSAYPDDPNAVFVRSVSEATLAAMIGFLVCAMFLSLQLYELFYFLCLVTNVVVIIGARIQHAHAQTMDDSHQKVDPASMRRSGFSRARRSAALKL